MSRTVPIIVALALIATMGGMYMFSRNGHSFRGEKSVDAQFADWMKQYNKVYTSSAEMVYRRTVFAQNLAKVTKHNSLLGTSYKLGMNQFADLPVEEYRAMNMLKTKGYVPKNVKFMNVDAIPASVDWTTKGAVTPVKNQQQCGSCYTFSSTGSMEGRQFLDNAVLISMSEQQLVDCSSSYGNQGCNGGLMDDCFQYSEAQGIETEATYPYTAVTGTCAYNAASIIGWKPTGYTDIPANSSSQFLAAVAIQPVSIAVDASGDGFQLYTSGIYNDPSCGTSLDHGILAVGYNTAQGFIKIKNSWGASWGEAGYIRFALLTGTGNAGQCGIYMMSSYPLGK